MSLRWTMTTIALTVGQRLMGNPAQAYRWAIAEVRVEAVNMDERKIDFSLISANAHRATSVKRREKAKKAMQAKRRQASSGR